MKYQEIVEDIEEGLQSIDPKWDGKESILTLKENGGQWKQTEWMGFYFEYLCTTILKERSFSVPGKKYGNVEFDLFRDINWDVKAHSRKNAKDIPANSCILNDVEATDKSIEEYGRQGLIIGLFDAEYNDINRSFQEWHDNLKGQKTSYTKAREERGAPSRMRKMKVELQQILIVMINEEKKGLKHHNQGRNSGGNPRNIKYQLNLKTAHQIKKGEVDFR